MNVTDEPIIPQNVFVWQVPAAFLKNGYDSGDFRKN